MKRIALGIMIGIVIGLIGTAFAVSASAQTSPTATPNAQESAVQVEIKLDGGGWTWYECWPMGTGSPNKINVYLDYGGVGNVAVYSCVWSAQYNIMDSQYKESGDRVVMR